MSDSNKGKGITMADMLSPLYLHPSDGPHTGVITEKLNGPSNYKAWKCDMEIALASKRKLGFVTGLVKRDKDNAEKQEQWDTCNSMLVAWLTGSMTPQVKETVRYMRVAKDIWENLEKRYDITNGTRKYKLNKNLYDLKQKGITITEYYSKMKCLWDEIDSMRKYPPITEMNTEVNAYIDARNWEKEQDKLFQFLNGLDEQYASERSHMLMFTPLPTVEEAYSRLVQEEAQREIAKENREEVETGAMFSKRDEWCSVCEIKGHSKEKCWKVIGYPDWHPRNKRFERGRGFRGGTSAGRGWNTSGGRGWNRDKQVQGDVKKNTNSSRMAANAKADDGVSITADQLERLLKLTQNYNKGGSETEEEIETSFAGLTYPEY